jgi:hypothetical protein
MDYKWYAKNQWRMPITNYGTFGYGINRAGGEWPRGSGNMYIYGAGIWVGCLPTRRETLVTSGYDPSSGRSEFTPGCWDNSTTPGSYARDFERVYIYPEDWPPNPTDFPTSLQDSSETSLRIPLATGDTIHGMFYPIPRTTVSTSDAWAVFNDRDISRHVNSDAAIGVEIYQSTYSWSLPWNRDIVFFMLTLKNVSGNELKDMYLGMACDADIGDANMSEIVPLLIRSMPIMSVMFLTAILMKVGICLPDMSDLTSYRVPTLTMMVLTMTMMVSLMKVRMELTITIMD